MTLSTSALVGTGPEVVIATSIQDAVKAFGDGVGVTVVAGGTIVVPLLASGRLRPVRVLMLHAAGLDKVSDEADFRIGAMVRLADLAAVGFEPLASAARITDFEVRGQATVGGNLAAGGDLQSALVALEARVHSVGPGGERVDAIEDFVRSGEPRLIVAIEATRAEAGAFIAHRRRHSHTRTVLSVAVARMDGITRVAVGGAAEHAVRCRSVERALMEGVIPRNAAEAVVEDVRPQDDALASAWYRRRVLPVLVARALARLKGAM
jgi:CO/xanthine dehydrogenase FAD-binding subunit